MPLSLPPLGRAWPAAAAAAALAPGVAAAVAARARRSSSRFVVAPAPSLLFEGGGGSAALATGGFGCWKAVSTVHVERDSGEPRMFAFGSIESLSTDLAALPAETAKACAILRGEQRRAKSGRRVTCDAPVLFATSVALEHECAGSFFFEFDVRRRRRLC